MEADVPIDTADLLARCMGDGTFVREILGVFHEQAKSHLAQLQAGVKVGDRERMQQFAHAMKGSAANLGAVPLSHACGEFEESARQGSTDTIEQLLSKLERELARCVAFFPEVLRRIDPATTDHK